MAAAQRATLPPPMPKPPSHRRHRLRRRRPLPPPVLIAAVALTLTLSATPSPPPHNAAAALSAASNGPLPPPRTPPTAHPSTQPLLPARPGPPPMARVPDPAYFYIPLIIGLPVMHRPLAVMLTRTMEDQADGPFATGEEGQQRTSHAPNKPLSLSHPFPLLHVPSHSPNSARRKSSWRTSSSTRTTMPRRRVSNSTHQHWRRDRSPHTTPVQGALGRQPRGQPGRGGEDGARECGGRTHGDHKLRPGARGALKKLFGKVHAHMKRHAAKPAQPLSNSLAPDNPLTLTLSLSSTVARQEGRQNAGAEEARQDRHARPRLE